MSQEQQVVPQLLSSDADDTTHNPSLQESDAEKAQPSPIAGHEAPDGGAAAWLVVLGAWCASFCSFGWLSSVGVFQEYYQNVLLKDYSPSTISWIPSLQIFFLMASGPIVGMIYDRHGPRWVLIFGSSLHVLGVMMTSLSTQYYQVLLAQGVCSGIGSAAIFQPSLSVVHGWFSKNAGAAFGILTTGSSIGGIIFPIMVNRLVRSLGFGWAMRISGFLILALLLISNLTIRANYRPIPQKITRRQLIQPFRERSFLLVSAGFFFFTLGFYAVINYLAVQVLAAGMNPDLAQYIVSILNSGSLFGRLSAGLFGDKIGRYNVFIIVSYMSGILILALWLPASNDAALLAFAVLFGFCSGAYVTLLAPLIKQISPLSEIGFRTGLTFLASSVSGLTTSPINGALLEASGGFRNVMIFSGVMAVFGTTLVVAVRVEKTGWKLFVNF